MQREKRAPMGVSGVAMNRRYQEPMKPLVSRVPGASAPAQPSTSLPQQQAKERPSGSSQSRWALRNGLHLWALTATIIATPWCPSHRRAKSVEVLAVSPTGRGLRLTRLGGVDPAG
jgi:hypothetical protein